MKIASIISLFSSVSGAFPVAGLFQRTLYNLQSVCNQFTTKPVDWSMPQITDDAVLMSKLDRGILTEQDLIKFNPDHVLRFCMRAQAALQASALRTLAASFQQEELKRASLEDDLQRRNESLISQLDPVNKLNEIIEYILANGADDVTQVDEDELVRDVLDEKLSLDQFVARHPQPCSRTIAARLQKAEKIQYGQEYLVRLIQEDEHRYADLTQKVDQIRREYREVEFTRLRSY